MRVLAFLAAGAALAFASTAAASPREEADDRFTEVLYTVNYSRAVEGAVVEAVTTAGGDGWLLGQEEVDAVDVDYPIGVLYSVAEDARVAG